MGKGFDSIGCNYTGIDADAESITFARQQGIQAYCLPAEEITATLEERKYDLILSSHVFEHLNDPHKVFKNLVALCAGIIIIIVPNPQGLFAWLRSNRQIRKIMKFMLGHDQDTAFSIDGYWHRIAYSKKTMKYLCEQAGLDALKIMPISINDPVFGFVQPNKSLAYKIASSIASLVRMDSDLILVARPLL